MEELAEFRTQLNQIDRDVVGLQAEAKSFYRRHDNADAAHNELERDFLQHQRLQIAMNGKIAGGLLVIITMIPIATSIIAWLLVHGR